MRASSPDGKRALWSARLPSVPLGAFDHRTGEAFAFAGSDDESDGAPSDANMNILVGAHAGGFYALPPGLGGGGGGGGGGGDGGGGTST